MDDPEVSVSNDIMHQWAYSFMNATFKLGDLEDPAVFLVGYCKGCRTSFSCRVALDTAVGYVVLTNTDIPRFGCTPAPY